MGLNLMQPVPAGQNLLGHIGQAVGAGMEARDRSLGADISRTLEERKLNIQEERLSGRGGFSVKELFKAQESDATRRQGFYKDMAKSIEERANDPLNTGANAVYPEFKGLGQAEIMEKILSDPVQRAKYDRLYSASRGQAPTAAPAAAVPGAPTNKIPVAQLQQTKPQVISTIQKALTSSDPDIQNKAKGKIAQLRQMVSDPETLDSIFGPQ